MNLCVGREGRGVDGVNVEMGETGKMHTVRLCLSLLPANTARRAAMASRDASPSPPPADARVTTSVWRRRDRRVVVAHARAVGMAPPAPPPRTTAEEEAGRALVSGLFCDIVIIVVVPRRGIAEAIDAAIGIVRRCRCYSLSSVMRARARASLSFSRDVVLFLCYICAQHGARAVFCRERGGREIW